MNHKYYEYMVNKILLPIIVAATACLFLPAYGRSDIARKTVAEFLEMDDSDSTLCLLKGVVCRVRNYDKGRLFIDDGTGTVLIYNIFDPKHSRSFPGTDVRTGDTLTVIGRRVVYDGRVIEMKNALYVSHSEGPDHRNVVKRDSLDKAPTFRGKSANEFSKWVTAHLKYPKEAKKSYVDGKVVVKFVIGRDGSVLYPEIVEGTHPALNEEVIRVLKKAPKWKPGIVDNIPVRVSLSMPVFFVLEM